MVELQGAAPTVVLHLLGGAFSVGRIFHSIATVPKFWVRGRMIGMGLTYASITGTSTLLLIHAAKSALH